MKACRIVSSWPLDSTIGSGTTNVVRATRKIFSALGYRALVSSGEYPPGGYVSTGLRRVWFNARLNRRLRGDDGIPTIAFDFDGFAFPQNKRFVSVNQGILADVVKFDSGLVASALSAMARLEAVAVRKAERVFTPSRFSADKIMALYGLPSEKIEVAPNGLFAEDVPPFSPRTSAPPVVLCIARLYKRKGVDLLLRAWPEITSKIPGAILKIAGDGLEAKNLRRLTAELGIEKTALFLGDVSSRDKIAELYAEASLFCLPTLHETFGIVFIEAMAAGLPVVAVNDTAVPEVVRDGEDGLLVQPEPGRIARSVVSLLNDGALREKMGRAGRERVLKEFLWKKTSAGMVDYISRW